MEAAQDVFVQLVRRREHLTGDAPAGLLLQIATNICLNILRSQKRHPEDRDSDRLYRVACAHDTEAGILARLRLERILGREHPSTRLIAVLHYGDGLTHEQVAREVGLSVSGVRKRLRALRARALEIEGTWP